MNYIETNTKHVLYLVRLYSISPTIAKVIRYIIHHESSNNIMTGSGHHSPKCIGHHIAIQDISGGYLIKDHN